MTRMATERPYLFVIVVFLAESLLPVPLVVAWRATGSALEPLRLIIPVAQTVFVLGVIARLGWFSETGFTSPARAVHLYGVPFALTFVPALYAGTVAIPSGSVTFYFLAVLFTAISEEGLARGILLRALLPKGRWVALLTTAVLFAVAHLSNLVFADPGVTGMLEVLLATFAFAIGYGAVMIRTGNILPLIALHTLEDYIYVTSGTAGPFVAHPFPLTAHVLLALGFVGYGMWLLRKNAVDAS